MSRIERGARYHRDLRQYVGNYRNPNNWVQYAIDNSKWISTLMKIQTLCGILLFLIGIIQQDLCDSITGCNDIGQTACGYYYFGQWIKSGINIWGGILILIFGAYGWNQADSPSYSSIELSFILSICGVILSVTLAITEGVGMVFVIICNSGDSDGLIALFSVAIVAYIISFVAFIQSTKHTGTAVDDHFPCNCRSRADSDDENEREVSTIRRAEQMRPIAGGITRVGPTPNSANTDTSSYNHAYDREESLPGYPSDPPPDYDTVFPPNAPTSTTNTVTSEL